MFSIIKKLQTQVDLILDYVGHYYVYTMLGLHITYIFAIFGILALESMYLRLFNVFIQVFVCFFLILRFHPFRKHELRENDARIIFSSAAFLLFNLGIIEYFTRFGTNLFHSVENQIIS